MCLKVLKKSLREGESRRDLFGLIHIGRCVNIDVLLVYTIGDACSLCDDWCSIEEKIQLFERLLGLQVSCL